MKKLIILSLCFFACIGWAKADNDTPVTVEEMPKAAQEFLKKHFAEKEILLAKMEKDLWYKKYEVVFADNDRVEFDKDGQWEEVSCRASGVPAAVLPQAIREDVAKRYPKAKVLRIERDEDDYEVKLDNRLELKYNRKFQLVDIDD